MHYLRNVNLHIRPVLSLTLPATAIMRFSLVAEYYIAAYCASQILNII
jgi:hypothetical protein